MITLYLAQIGQVDLWLLLLERKEWLARITTAEPLNDYYLLYLFYVLYVVSVNPRDRFHSVV